MNAIDLKGRVAVITGGAQGIGFAVAQRLVASGAKVSLWDMNATILAEAKAALGEAASTVQVNITDYDAVAAAVAQTEEALGKIDILVNSAGIAGKEGNPNAAAYAAAKAGVIGLTKAVGKECAKYDIANNAITPATAKTRILDELKPEFIDYMLSRIPRGRFLEDEEAASMVAWLVSQENSFTTASVFDLSGGRATY
jgi:3-oxoacyl-[acyl-carrier protein] reductase